MRSVSEVAKELDLRRESVAQMLKRMSAPKCGNQYVIDDILFKKLEERRGALGRPKGSKNKKSPEE